MKTYTVAELARLAGISVRTLHHYDEIGLLKPAFTGNNRYRHYGRDELLRLQQILVYRELDIPLGDIAALLDRPEADRLALLVEQRDRLEARVSHFAGLLATIDRTIAGLKGEADMDDKELYGGVVSPEKHAEYEQWLTHRFGEGTRDHIETRRAAWSKLSRAEVDAMMAELKDVEQGLMAAMRRGVAPDSPELLPLLERHRNWVQLGWGPKEATLQAYRGLAEIYISHPDFVARYEAIAPGFAEFLHHAMVAETRRLGA
jgi:DNA-binding transcriptional MerR regulator